MSDTLSKLQALRPLPVVQTRVQTYQMMRSMVEAGEGLAIVDPFTAFGAREAGLDACPVSPPIMVSLYALTLKDSVTAPALNALLEIVTQKAQGLLEQMDKHLASHCSPWFLGEEFSLVDIYAMMLCRWTRHFDDKKARDYPFIALWVQKVLARPAVQKVMDYDGLVKPYV